MKNNRLLILIQKKCRKKPVGIVSYKLEYKLLLKFIARNKTLTLMLPIFLQLKYRNVVIKN